MGKRAYKGPSLVSYGRLADVTMGVSGTLPDLDITLNNVTDNCLEQELATGQKTIFCVVAGGSLP